MTLALYGKSRRRQGALITAALLAVIIASIGALSVITSAFAHHSTHEIKGDCASWTYKANFYGGGQNGTWRRVEVYQRTVPGGSWTKVHTQEFDGKSNVTPFFTKTGSGWSEFKIEMYTNQSNPTDANSEEPDNVKKECATIIIKKVVSGPGANPNQAFTASVNNEDGSAGDASGLSFSQAAPYVHTFGGHDGSGQNQDDFIVKETVVAPGYQLSGYKVLDGDAACPAANSGEWVTTNPQNGARIDNLGYTTKTVCFLNTTLTGTLIVGKVKDPSSGVPAADGSQFSGTATNQGNSAVHTWGPITFGAFSTISSIPAGTYTLAETGTQNGWTVYGWTNGTLTQNGPTCPSAKTSYTAGSTLTNVQVTANQTKVVCVMNTKTTGNIQVHKYLPKSNPNDNAPWQNQGNGQSQWTFTVYGSLSDAQNGTNPLASFNQLGSNSPALPQTDLWIKETGMPPGHQFFAWFVPDGDGNSGNDKCNQKPLDGTGLDTSVILHVPASVWSTKGNNTGLLHICAYNKPAPPTVTKTAGNPAYSSGYAYWNISIQNPANSAVEVHVTDAGAQLVNNPQSNCTGTDLNTGIVCTVAASSTLTIPVKKASAQQCREGSASNSVTVKWRTPGADQWTNIGTIDGGTITIPADESKCGLPTITKEASQTVQNNQTTNPADIAWNVTVTNPNGTNGIQRTVRIKDANVTVTAGPTYSGGASCTGTFATELTDSDGVQCTMPAGSSITFTVKPNPAPQRTCQDQVFTNTASLYMSSGELVALIGEASSTITLLGNPELCTREVKVCKVLENNNDGITRSGMTFNFDIRPQNSSTIQVAINNVTEGGQPDNCKVVQVPANKSFDVAEWMSRPTGWNGDAAGYPKYSINSGSQVSNNTTTMISAGTDPVTVVFYNKEKVVKNVTFSKYICDTFGDVPRNEGPGGQDDTGKNVFGGGGLNGLLGPKGPSNDTAPVTPNNDNRGNCALATTPWTFNLWTSDRVNGSGGTLLQTVTVTGSQTVALNDQVIQHMQAQGNTLGVYVEEVYQAGYAFGALKCYTDHLNDDNWEWIDPSALQEQDEIHCIAYNVKITPPKLTVKKVTKAADGTTTIQSSDQFSFTVEPSTGVSPASFSLDTDPNTGLVPDTKAVTLPASSTSGGVAYTITETAPASWLLESVVCQDAQGNNVPATVNLQAGTAQVTLQTGGVAAAASDVTCTFTNAQRKGTIIVHKVYPEGFTPDGATFSGGFDRNVNGEFDDINDYTWGPLAVGSSQTIEALPGLYNVSEDPKTGYELVGWSATSAYLACNPGMVSLQSVNDGDIIVLPGETTNVWFCNRPLGTIVIVKYENVPPATAQTWNFTGTVPTLPTSLSTTGTTNSVGTASTTILNVPVGTYTIAETQGRRECTTGTTSSDWETRGLVQVGGSLPGAGAVNAAPIVSNGSLNVPVQAGQTTYVVFGNIGCGSVLSAANLVVNKFSDPFANFTGTTPLSGWSITITGTAGTANGQTFTATTNGAGQAFFLGIPDGTYTVCETLQPGWQNVGSKYNAVNQAGLCRTGITVNLNETATVNFYNQPRVTIRVQKTLNVIGFTSPGAGWTFTLTGCGIASQQGTTNQNGVVEFTDLPPAIGCSYTVTETVQSGWTPQFISQTAQPTQGGQVVTLTFLNIRDFNPPCVDPNDPRCVPPPPPTVTPTPPTPTTTPPTTTTPTNTPTPTATPTNTPTPTPTNTPVTQVAGERTPGPGQSPTPLAPAAGFGFGHGQGGMSLLLVLAGLVSLSLGLGFLALGRRTNR